MAASAKKPADIERLSGITGDKDRQELVETLVRAYTPLGSFETLLRQCLLRPPFFKPEHARVAVADGRVVAGAILGPRMIRFGPAKAPAVTIGMVGTHDHYRKHGYASALMDDISRYLADNGYLVAYLGAIDDYYYRFGYYPFSAISSVRFKRRNAEKESLPARLRAMTRRDLPVVRRIYDAATAGRVCAAARDRAVWDWLLGPAACRGPGWKPKVILNERGRIYGYVICENRPDRTFPEIVTRRDEASCRVALGALVREARRRRLNEIQLNLPWDDALAVCLRQHVRCEFNMDCRPSGGPLMKIIDFPALMRTLEPLFTRRWLDAHTALPPLRFTMQSEIGSVGIITGRSGVRIGDAVVGPRVKVPERWLAGMLTGYFTPRDIAPKKRAAIPADLMPAMGILFPAGWPFVYAADSY